MRGEAHLQRGTERRYYRCPKLGCRARVDDMLAEEEARSTAEARYLDGREAVFPDTLAIWATRLHESQELAVMADRLCELDGVPPFVPPDPDATAERVRAHLADLVEPARSSTLDKLDEGRQALTIATAWLRAKATQAGPATYLNR